MKQFRKVLALTLALVLSLSFAACASKSAAENVEKVPAEEATSDTVEQKGTITVAASPTPHAEILAQVAPILAAEGWTLEVKEFQDYVQPNNVVESGEFDANYFQHIPYLENFNEEQGTHLVNAGGIHYEPFGIYPGTKSSPDDIAEGDTIAVPNDTTNEARALLLLQDNGILKLKDGAGLTATVLDIEENPYNVEILELEAAQVPRVKDEVAYVKQHLGSIAPGISWSQVEKMMTKLMKEDPEKYPTENDTVDAALIKVSNKKVTYAKINQYKDTYDHFAWTITLAPADNPQIAVVVLLVQGGVSFNAAPIAREIIGDYLQVDTTTKTLDFSTKMN